MQAHDSRLVRLEALRTLVAEKFPPSPRRRDGRLRIGCEAFDQKGGFLRGAVTEVCGSSAGGSLLLAAVANAAVRDGFFVGLIDAANSFEPSDWADEHLAPHTLGDMRRGRPGNQGGGHFAAGWESAGSDFGSANAAERCNCGVFR